MNAAAPTKTEIEVALKYLAWLKVNFATKTPKKILRQLLLAASEAETLGWRFLAGQSVIDAEEVYAIITQAGIPLHDNQKKPAHAPLRTKILSGDKWVLERLKDDDGRKRIRTLVRLAQAKLKLDPANATENHVVRIMRIRPQWLDNK